MSGQISDIFGYNGQNDWNKWLENAKEDTGNLENVLTELHELEISLHERLIASLDQTSDYMADKQALYDAAIADIQHSMNLIQYVYGQDAYAQLSEYYDAMKDMQQRDYQNAVNNTLYWRSMMDQYTEGTEE